MATRAETTRAARRGALWNAACRIAPFSAFQLEDETKVEIKLVREIVAEWRDEGLIEEDHIGQNGRKFWRLSALGEQRRARGAGPGSIRRRPSARANMWRSMRGLQNFTARDIAVHSTTEEVTVSEEAALDYCQMLVRSGHLRAVQKALPGRRPAIYRLVRNTGPVPPKERRISAVWDENTREYAYIAGVTA